MLAARGCVSVFFFFCQCYDNNFVPQIKDCVCRSWYANISWVTRLVYAWRLIVVCWQHDVSMLCLMMDLATPIVLFLLISLRQGWSMLDAWSTRKPKNVNDNTHRHWLGFLTYNTSKASLGCRGIVPLGQLTPATNLGIRLIPATRGSFSSTGNTDATVKYIN